MWHKLSLLVVALWSLFYSGSLSAGKLKARKHYECGTCLGENVVSTEGRQIISGLISECLKSDTFSKAPAILASTTSFSQMTQTSTPLLLPFPLPKTMAPIPRLNATIQPTLSSQRLESISYSADVKMINPAHAQLLSASRLPNLRPTTPTTGYQTNCRPVIINAPA